VYHPRAVIVVGDSQVEPDLMVRPIAPLRGWENAPLPLLVVEVISSATRRRDLEIKRDFYIEAGIPEYWALDRHTRTVVRFAGPSSETLTSMLTWAPPRAIASLSIDLPALFSPTE
jgi:Uma2 family endonuclease